jgi:peptide/nickel transport system substrate-binding protein
MIKLGCRFLLGISVVMVLFGCSKSPSPKSGVFNLRLSGEPTILNPILSSDTASSAIENLVFNGLLRVNDELELIPDIAETYTISPDGKTYTFTLKKNVTFQDGHPLTAEDVAFTYNKILDPKTNTVRRGSYIIEGKPIQFKAIDTYTFQAILPKPFAPFLSQMTMGILPKHILEKVDINKNDFNRKPIGAGPYILERWETGQFVLLKKNPNYFGEKPKLDKILYKIVLDSNTATLSLEKKELHMSGLDPKDVAAFKQKPAFNVFDYEQLAYTYLGFNLKHPFLSDIRVREAIAHAVDKEALVKSVLQGFGKPAHIPNAPSSWSYPNEKDVYKLGYDPKKSKALLEEAGFTFDQKSGYYQKNGRPLSFTLVTNKGRKDREKSAEIIQQYLAKVGIKLDIRIVEWSSLVKLLETPKSPKDFDIVIIGWALGIDPDSFEIWHSSQFPKGLNFIGYNNPRVDTLLEKGRLEVSKDKRKVIYGEAYNTIAKDIPYLFLYYPKDIQGVQKTVHGLSKVGPAGLLNRIEQVYIKD